MKIDGAKLSDAKFHLFQILFNTNELKDNNFICLLYMNVKMLYCRTC